MTQIPVSTSSEQSIYASLERPGHNRDRARRPCGAGRRQSCNAYMSLIDEAACNKLFSSDPSGLDGYPKKILMMTPAPQTATQITGSKPPSLHKTLEYCSASRNLM